jgi:hypothetical protein
MLLGTVNRKRLGIVGVACAVCALLAAILAVVSPFDGKAYIYSFGLWLLCVPLMLLTYGVLEGLGSWALGLSFWKRMPGWARVSLLVIGICFVSVSVLFLAKMLLGRDAL